MKIKRLSVFVLSSIFVLLFFVGCSSFGGLHPVDVPMYYEGNSPALGYQDAQVSIVVYSDFSCAACKEEAIVLRHILDEYSDSVRLIYKYYPIKQHEQAMPAALAAQAASFQGRFWDMHDLIFNKQEELSHDLYVKLAQKLKLDAVLFVEDLIKPTAYALIDADISEGKRKGVRSVPTIIVDGNIVLRGPQSEESISRVVDQELMRKSMMVWREDK